MHTPVVIYPLPSRNCCEPSAVNEDHDFTVFAGAWTGDGFDGISFGEWVVGIDIVFASRGIWGRGGRRSALYFFFFVINLFRKIFFRKGRSCFEVIFDAKFLKLKLFEIYLVLISITYFRYWFVYAFDVRYNVYFMKKKKKKKKNRWNGDF